jgi:hypothetical protein
MQRRKPQDRRSKNFAGAHWLHLIGAALNGRRACLSDVSPSNLNPSDVSLTNLGVNRRWNRIASPGLTKVN